MNIQDKINNGDYTNKLAYPPHPLPSDSDEVKDEWVRLKAAYRAEETRLVTQFRADALEEAGIAQHPKADLAYSMAWEEGHSSGISEVWYYLERFAELLK